jgi:H+-transporting ATPase
VIQARELVPGDLVRVRIGDFVPADIKIVDGTLDVDQSALTGESGTVEKSGGNGELVYSGSAVKRGEATGIVYATGTRTYFGRSVELVELAKPRLHMEEITIKVARRLTIIVVAALIGAILYALMTGMICTILRGKISRRWLLV